MTLHERGFPGQGIAKHATGKTEVLPVVLVVCVCSAASAVQCEQYSVSSTTEGTFALRLTRVGNFVTQNQFSPGTAVLCKPSFVPET